MAEVVSESDDVAVPGTNRSWVDVKRDLYRSHILSDVSPLTPTAPRPTAVLRVWQFLRSHVERIRR